MQTFVVIILLTGIKYFMRFTGEMDIEGFRLQETRSGEDREHRYKSRKAQSGKQRDGAGCVGR